MEARAVMADRRVVVDYASNIPDRSPSEQLEVIRKIVNRDVERLHLLSKGGKESLPLDERELLDSTLERVTKLIRALKQAEEEQDITKMTTEELRKKVRAT